MASPLTASKTHRQAFWERMLIHSAISLGLLGASLLVGKIFAGLYALYAGLVVIAVTGLLLGPGVHHLMHHMHWVTQEGK